MSGLFSPDSVPGFDEVRPIDQAVMLRDYLAQIEEEQARVKALMEECCAKAVEQNDKDTDGWKLVVSYASGVAVKPDLSMLEASYPERYTQLKEQQLRDFKPKLVKADLDWLFADVDANKRDEAISLIMVEHPIKPQYKFVVKKEVSE